MIFGFSILINSKKHYAFLKIRSHLASPILQTGAILDTPKIEMMTSNFRHDVIWNILIARQIFTIYSISVESSFLAE